MEVSNILQPPFQILFIPESRFPNDLDFVPIGVDAVN